jgi:hypothetical protein
MSLISCLPLYMLTVCVVYLSLLSMSLFIMLALLLLCCCKQPTERKKSPYDILYIL